MTKFAANMSLAKKGVKHKTKSSRVKKSHRGVERNDEKKDSKQEGKMNSRRAVTQRKLRHKDGCLY